MICRHDNKDFLQYNTRCFLNQYQLLVNLKKEEVILCSFHVLKLPTGIGLANQEQLAGLV